MYLAWYGFGRFFIEGLRTDSLYVGPFRISQVVGLICFVVFGGLLTAGLIYSKKLEKKIFFSNFDKVLMPDMEMKPVFFAKKSKNSAKKVKKEENVIENQSEEYENGTDN